MLLLDELQKQSRILGAVGAVLEALHAQQGDASSAPHLQRAVEGVRGCGLTVASAVLEHIPIRALAGAVATEDLVGLPRC